MHSSSLFTPHGGGDLRRLYLIALADAAAGAAAEVALVLRLTSATGSGWVVAGLWLAQAVPAIALSPWVGLVIDRVETVVLLRMVTAAQAVLLGLLALTPGVGAVLGLGCLLGPTASVASAAGFALLGAIPQQGRRPGRTSPLALLQAAQWIGATTGPLAGAGLVAAWGSRCTLLLGAAVFLGCSSAMGTLGSRRPGRGPNSTQDAPWAGFRLLLSDRRLRDMLAPVACVILAVNLGVVIDVFLATRDLHAGALGYGGLVAAWGAGMIAGTLVGGRAPGESFWRVIAAGGLLAGVGLAAAGASPSIGWAIAAYLVGGAGNGLEATAARLLLQTRARSQDQGRAFAAYSAFGRGAAIAGTVAGGLALAPLGPRHALELAGALAVMAAVALLGQQRKPAMAG